MEKEQINQLLDKQRQYFYSGATLDLDFRISALKRLRASIRKHEDQIHAALKKDLGKSNFESYMETFPAARYHSLAAIRDTLPEELVVTAESEDGEVMALEHKEYPIFGLQFHPESVMTPDGKTMIENFMKVIRDR